MPTLCKVVQTNDALATLISENKVSLLGTHLQILVTFVINIHLSSQTIIVQEKFILIDFHATWCGPCKQIAPYLESLAGQYPDNLIIVKVRIITILFFMFLFQRNTEQILQGIKEILRWRNLS